MFEIKLEGNKEVRLRGRFDASQVEKATNALNQINESHTINFKELEYISSAGLGVLLATQKRLSEKGHKLKLIQMNNHIRDVFKWAGFDLVFEIE
ncbi:MAG: STAS domain-containing protein [bacterium]